MSKIHIFREHTLGIDEARKIAKQWQADCEQSYSLVCDYQVGADEDIIHFKRSGISGTLKVLPSSFELNAKLGFLFSAFKERMESEIVDNLDTLLG